jgi:hypothetical protein
MVGEYPDDGGEINLDDERDCRDEGDCFFNRAGRETLLKYLKTVFKQVGITLNSFF